MKKIFLPALLLFILSALYGQEGAPLLTHFRESRDIENQNWAICQDNNNVMLFANRKGILSFDGQEWFSTRLPTIPFSMKANPSDGRIFIGGDNDYGFLEKDEKGINNYISLAGDSADIGLVTRIILCDSVIWFYSDQSITRHSLGDGSLELRLTSDNNPFTGMFITPEHTFINVMDKGLFRLESDTLFPIVTGYLTEDTDILFSLPYDEEMVVVGLTSGQISLFDGIKYYDYNIKDEGYLSENILSEGIPIGDSLYAFTTLDGGALVVEKKSGEIRYTINNQNELPDDEIFAVGLDRSGGLWLSHQYGLTRADLNLPVGNFSIYPGLTGNLTTSLWHDDELYVATSEGVFYLAEVKNYSEVQILVKEEPESDAADQEDQEEEQKGSRQSIFSRIFGRRVDRKKEEAEADNGKEEESTNEERYTSKTVHRLKSVNYIYKKVEGFNEKCRQLVSTGDGILAATNKGLYIIKDHKGIVITDNRYINFISWQPVDNKYYVAAGDGYFSVWPEDGNWKSEIPDPSFADPVYSVLRIKDEIWLGVDNMALRAVADGEQVRGDYSRINVKTDYPQRYLLDYVSDTLFLYTESGIYFHDTDTDGFVQTRTGDVTGDAGTGYSYPLSNRPWIQHKDRWIYLREIDEKVEKEMSLFRVFDDIVSINSEEDRLWIVDGENRLFRIDLMKESGITPEMDIFFKSIYNEEGTVFNLSDIVFNRGDKIVNFDIVAPGYVKQNTTQYQYYIDKLMPDWSPWSIRTSYNLMVPVAGEYTLQVRAKDLWGNIGEPETVMFMIKAPFTQTKIFYLLLISTIFMMLFFVVRFRERQLQKKNRFLEQKVRERTAEIQAQKEEITSSIEYASRIQMAMLPIDTLFKNSFSEHFIFFRPRDIVSGDFYWIGEDEKHIFFTVADCTGHGVPGAFMSTLGISTLNEIITNSSDLKANTILQLLRDKVKTSLHQTGKEGEAADGMDLAFCVLDKDRKKLQFSGAYNPLFLFQDDELKEYKADRMPIGIYYGEKDTFTNYEIKIRRGDVIYIFSDGLADQFGGPDGAKFKKTKFKNLLSEIHTKPMAEQYRIIENEFRTWSGSYDQVDDITILGVKI